MQAEHHQGGEIEEPQKGDPEKPGILQSGPGPVHIFGDKTGPSRHRGDAEPESGNQDGRGRFLHGSCGVGVLSGVVWLAARWNGGIRRGRRGPEVIEEKVGGGTANPANQRESKGTWERDTKNTGTTKRTVGGRWDVRNMALRFGKTVPVRQVGDGEDKKGGGDT